MVLFLAKTDPETYSIDDLKRDGTTEWNGVRNPAARHPCSIHANLSSETSVPTCTMISFEADTQASRTPGIASNAAAPSPSGPLQRRRGDLGLRPMRCATLRPVPEQARKKRHITLARLGHLDHAPSLSWPRDFSAWAHAIPLLSHGGKLSGAENGLAFHG
jgi:hypothetical protein